MLDLAVMFSVCRYMWVKTVFYLVRQSIRQSLHMRAKDAYSESGGMALSQTPLLPSVYKPNYIKETAHLAIFGHVSRRTWLFKLL